jgi:hypothetical protein
MKVEAYQLFLDVEAGRVTPEEAQIELLEMLETVKQESPDVYSGDAIKNCPLAIYEVFWKEGGSSVASIGYTHDGTRWLAPTNWTCKNDDNPTCLLDDKRIATIDRIVLLYTQNRD